MLTLEQCKQILNSGKRKYADIDIYNSVYGIGMQLIVYLYLITKSDLFTNYSCVGFYLQKIINENNNMREIQNNNNIIGDD